MKRNSQSSSSANMSETAKSFDLRICFPKYQSTENELKKAGLLRIVIGLLLIIRFGEILHSHHVINSFRDSLFINNEIAVFSLAIVLFMTGLLTQISTVALLYFLPSVDRFFGTSTLGTSILACTLFVLLLLNSGQHYSLDSFFLRSRRLACRFLNPFLNFLGASNLKEVQIAYFVGITSYAISSFTALRYHLTDSFWLEGLTTKSLLTNAFLCKHYDFFRALDVAFPSLLSLLSIAASIGQTVFQLFMIPLMFLTIGRWFVFIWGMQFFLISLFFINLSYLPHVEIILWVLIFCPVGRGGTRIQVFYDDRCNLCRSTIWLLRCLNYNSALSLQGMSTSKELYSKAGISDAQVQSEMAGLVGDTVVIGYDLYIAIAKANILLWPLLPILILGRVSRVGPLVYKYIAARRLKVFGACRLGNIKPIAEQRVFHNARLNRIVRTGVCCWFACCAFMHIVSENPGLTNISKLVYPKKSLLNWRKYARHLGIETPIVFNHADLSMGDAWLNLYVRENDKWELVPIRGEAGERLNYQNYDLLNFTNHNSDKLYFGDTLGISRALIARKRNLESYFKTAKQDGLLAVEKRIKYDYNYRQRKGPVHYKVIVRLNRASKTIHWDPEPERYEPTIGFQRRYVYGKRRGLREVTSEKQLR